MTSVVIEGLGASGDGVARLADGRVVFVEGGLPGDRVSIEPTHLHRRVQYARLRELVAPSPDRVTSRCQLDRCGGCALRALALNAQLEAKRRRIVEALRRLGHVDVDQLVGPVRAIGDGWSYRHRVRLQAAWSHGWHVGYYARRSHRVLPFTRCPVLLPELEAATVGLVRQLQRLPKEVGLYEVSVAYSQRDARAAALLKVHGPLQLFRQNAAWFAETTVAGVEVQNTTQRWRHGNVELRYDHRRADQFDLRFEPAVFTQAHPQANDRLVESVVAAARARDNPNVLELHAGIGNFSLPLALAGARVTASENHRAAALLCRRNAKAAGLPVEVHDEPAENMPVLGYDVVVVDPPRTGARVVCERLRECGAPRIVYVSCDPATLARDTAILAASYRLIHLEAYDLFPQTPHVESLAVFERA